MDDRDGANVSVRGRDNRLNQAPALAVTCMEFKTTVIDVAMRQLQYNEVFETKPFLIELQIDCKMRVKKL